MCGIVGVLQVETSRTPPRQADIEPTLVEAATRLREAGAAPDAATLTAELAVAAQHLEAVDAQLRGVPGLLALAGHDGLAPRVAGHLDGLEPAADAAERRLDELAGAVAGGSVEAMNEALARVRDALWALRRDRLGAVAGVESLAGREAPRSALTGLYPVQLALSALDRLEVRGRDSAGVHLFVTGHGLDLDAPDVRPLVADRLRNRLFTSMAVREANGALSFVYKAAAEIGELGDNTRALRQAIASDRVLALALQSPTAKVAVLAHTRWASVGLISEANAHPLNQEEDGLELEPYVVAALNGDVDNHGDLRVAERLQIPVEITTDAKVIPALVARRAAAAGGVADLTEAFRRTVAEFEGSVAIAAASAEQPDTLLLAQRGSGQALYVGLGDGLFVAASEPYGLVEVTSTYLRLDGETPARPDQPNASRGQVVVLDGRRAGELDGIRRLAYDGTELPVQPDDLQHVEITTRDIDRGDHPHFLLKELAESPASFRKTLRGRIVERDGRLVAALGPASLPPVLVDRLAAGELKRVVVIGQGTAAVAGQSLAALLRKLTEGSGLRVEALTAAEFSGFGLAPDLADTLVVAVSQSGTTTDTNRTVDLARGRGATVIAIVNRRHSDLTDKSDGVVYTPDGRDVEMSVASTKAFYSQVAAGCLIACALADAIGAGGEIGLRERHELLAGLRALPDAMAAVLAARADVAVAAQQLAPARRSWAVVGNGPNRVAAAEVRIKLSELCYKSIACDVTEDKKHIDLSSEPLILVCAAGLVGSTADDVAKEVAIYRAHKAAPVVIATEGEERFRAALHVVNVPPAHPELAFVLSAMAGHLFGYEAALAIDAQARPLREARGALEAAATAGATGYELLLRVAPTLHPLARWLTDGLRSGALNGHLEASTAVQLMSVLRYAVGVSALDAYELEHGKPGTPEVVVQDLVAALTVAIEELTRPIDAIKHQAKTVTVGISRSDEALLGNRLVQAVLHAGAARDGLSYKTLRTLANLEPAVEEVLGSTRYRIEGDPQHGDATITVVDREGISLSIPSRTERSPVLRGNKRQVAVEREVLVARGRADGRTVLFVPEVKGSQTTGITLLHVRYAQRLPAAVARGVLEGYRHRYAQLSDVVTETEPTFRDDLLAEFDVLTLLTEPVVNLAEHWRSAAS